MVLRWLTLLAAVLLAMPRANAIAGPCAAIGHACPCDAQTDAPDPVARRMPCCERGRTEVDAPVAAFAQSPTLAVSPETASWLRDPATWPTSDASVASDRRARAPPRPAYLRHARLLI